MEASPWADSISFRTQDGVGILSATVCRAEVKCVAMACSHVTWIDAARATLVTGEPRELEVLEDLMQRGPMHLPEGLDASELR